VVVASLLTWRVARSRASGPLMQVAAKTLHDARTHVLAQLDDAAVEVTGHAPLDLRSAGTFGPVVHQPFGAGRVAWCDFTSCNHQRSSIYTARFRCRLSAVSDNSGKNLVWIGMTLLGVVFGLLLFGVAGAIIGGIILFVVGAFATRIKPTAKPDGDKP